MKLFWERLLPFRKTLKVENEFADLQPGDVVFWGINSRPSWRILVEGQAYKGKAGKYTWIAINGGNPDSQWWDSLELVNEVYYPHVIKHIRPDYKPKLNEEASRVRY